MSSHLSFANLTTSSPLDPFPSYTVDFAGTSNSSSSPVYRGGTRAIALFSSSPPEDVDTSQEQDTANSVNMDRKRRLTATANDDATLHRRPSALSGPRSLSYDRLQQDRPLPSLPSADDRIDYMPSDIPGSSWENAIDLTSPLSAPANTSAPLSPQHSRSLPTVHQQRRQNLMEYTLPRWQPDSEVTHCPICKSQFSFFYRKHHCRKCGRVVCAACSPHRITIPRQYIVRPPEPVEQSSAEFLSHHRRNSSRALVDLTADDRRDTATRSLSRPRLETYPSNPALGGGEEVRLCNPCVPDPNPDPPVNYDALRPSFDRLPGQDWESTMPIVPISQRFHQVRRSLSGAQRLGSRRDPDGEAEDTARRNQVLDDFLGRRTSSAVPTPPEPSRSQQYGSSHHAASSSLVHPAPQSSARVQSHSFSSYRPRLEHESGIVAPFDPSATRPRRVRSMADPHRDRTARPSQQAPMDERDICPICSTRLPPRRSDGNEEEREAHIRDCIARSTEADRPSPGTGSPQSSHLLRMLSFTATEKDCLSEDGTPQECTICMEEYAVGDRLARLECLCKFHKSCIVGWFERKKECPVHKFS